MQIWLLPIEQYLPEQPSNEFIVSIARLYIIKFALFLYRQKPNFLKPILLFTIN